MAIIKPNNNTLSAITSLPAGVGGKVLQVVQGTSTTEISTSSTSYVTTNLSANITPSSSSNKIMISIAGSGREDADGNTVQYTIFRDSTNLEGATDKGFCDLGSTGATYVKGAYTVFYLDSPSSTSQITYAFYMKNQNGSGGCRAMHRNSLSTITLMEIAGWL